MMPTERMKGHGLAGVAEGTSLPQAQQAVLSSVQSASSVSPSVLDAREWGRLLLAGAVSGLCAGLLFATAHALVIVPIWGRMFGGLFGAALTGTAIAWGYGELVLRRALTAGAGATPSVYAGARFGALLWLSVAPVTLVCALLPGTGFARRYESLEVVIAIVLALAGGALLGDRLAGTRRARLAGAAGALALTLAMGGPVPIANGGRALRIFLAVLPVCVGAGAVLGLTATSRARSRRNLPDRSPVEDTLGPAATPADR